MANTTTDKVLKFLLKNGLKAFESFECPQNAPECLVKRSKPFDSKTIPLLQTSPYEPLKSLYSDADISHHLYVPVVVTKMLHYDFTARYCSGTTYDPETYPSSYRNLIENFGNPVTLKFTYIYKQEAKDWATAINSGENIQRNYTKELMFKVTSNAFPTDAELILVDPNNDRDLYYTSNLSANSNVLTEYASMTIDGVTTVEYRLKLAEFSGFSPIMLNDLMTVSLDTSATEKTLVVDNSNYTVIINDNSNISRKSITQSPVPSKKVTKHFKKLRTGE